MIFISSNVAHINDNDLIREASLLHCDPNSIGAVCDVESAKSGFLPDKRPAILYEAHVFGRLTKYRWNSSHPNISAVHWDRSLYGAPGAHQYERLAQAMALDETAALEATSWGLFQILGMNFGGCDFTSVQAFVEAQVESEYKQLSTFGFMCQQRGYDRFLRQHDWVRFALAWNGAGERANHYDEKLAAAYKAREHKIKLIGIPGHTTAPELIGLPLVTAE